MNRPPPGLCSFRALHEAPLHPQTISVGAPLAVAHAVHWKSIKIPGENVQGCGFAGFFSSRFHFSAGTSGAPSPTDRISGFTVGADALGGPRPWPPCLKGAPPQAVGDRSLRPSGSPLFFQKEAPTEKTTAAPCGAAGFLLHPDAKPSGAGSCRKGRTGLTVNQAPHSGAPDDHTVLL